MTSATERAPISPAGEPMQPRMVRVRRIRRETPNTFSLELVGPAGAAFSFEPGQFNMVGVLGVGEVPISVSGDPAQKDILVHTIRVVGSVTEALGGLRTGDWVAVRGPYGHPWPLKLAEGRDLVLVCGGIGLAPMRPVVYSVLNDRARYGKLVVLYGTRTREDILFRKELAAWQFQQDIDLELTLDRGHGVWRGNVGVVTDLIARLAVDASNAVAMVCGYEFMMRFIAQSLLAQGLDASQVFISLDRNMKCGIGLCGHCQFHGEFVCRTGPIYRYSDIASLLSVREL